MTDRKEDLEDRSHFIGGSDARVIMGGDEAALIRRWQEKRGEAEPPDLSGNLDRPAGARHRGAQSLLVRAYVRPPGRPVPNPQVPSLRGLDGRDPGRDGRANRGGV